MSKVYKGQPTRPGHRWRLFVDELPTEFFLYDAAEAFDYVTNENRGPKHFPGSRLDMDEEPYLAAVESAPADSGAGAEGA